MIDLTLMQSQEWDLFLHFLRSSALLVGYAVLEDIVSIVNIRGCGKNTDGRDMSNTIRDNVNAGSLGRYYDLSITAKQIMGTEIARSRKIGLCPETLKLKGLFAEMYLADIGPHQTDFSILRNRQNLAKETGASGSIAICRNGRIFLAGDLYGRVPLWIRDWTMWGDFAFSP